MKNLHVVFTMNPSEDGLKDKAATSPALFNRCVLNWFGDWGLSALFQVGKEFTLKMDLERPTWKQPDFLHFKVRFAFTETYAFSMRNLSNFVRWLEFIYSQSQD